MLEKIDWSNLQIVFVIGFVVVGFAVVAGLLLQAMAVISQSKSFTGLFIKFAAMGALLVLVYFVKTNAIPYLAIFIASLIVSLAAASLARRSLIR